MLPFAEQIFTLLLFILLAPSVWGVFLIYQGQLASGLAVLGIWVAAFIGIAIFLNQKRVVRLWVSIPSALLVFLAAIFVFFAP